MANQAFLNKMKGKNKNLNSSRNSNVNQNKTNNENNFDEDEFMGSNFLGIKDDAANYNSDNDISKKANDLISKAESLEENENFEDSIDPTNISVGLDLFEGLVDAPKGNMSNNTNNFNNNGNNNDNINYEDINEMNVDEPKIDKSNEEAEKIRKENEILKSGLKDAKLTIDNLNSQIEDFKILIETLKSNNSDNNSDNSEEIKNLLEDKIKLEKEISNLNKDYKSALDDIKDLNKEIRDKDSEISKTNEKYEKLLSDLKENGILDSNNDIVINNNTLEENEFLKGKIEELENKIKLMNNETEVEEEENSIQNSDIQEVVDYHNFDSLEDELLINEVSKKVLAYVCLETVKHLLENYSSEMYTEKYTKKLFESYINGTLDSSNILFGELISEVIESDFNDPYLNDLTKDVLEFIETDKSGLNKNCEFIFSNDDSSENLESSGKNEKIDSDDNNNDNNNLNSKDVSETPTRKRGRPKVN